MVRRDQPQDSLSTEARIIQGPCLGTLKLGLEWSSRQQPARQEWVDTEIEGPNMLNLSAKHMVYRPDTGNMGNNHFHAHPARNAGTIVVFDHCGSAIELDKIQAIDAYLQDIARLAEEDNGLGTIEPSIEGFDAFWNQWKDNKEGHEQPASTEPVDHGAEASASQHEEDNHNQLMDAGSMAH